jgi:hypothetical protein
MCGAGSQAVRMRRMRSRRSVRAAADWRLAPAASFGEMREKKNKRQERRCLSTIEAGRVGIH